MLAEKPRHTKVSVADESNSWLIGIRHCHPRLWDINKWFGGLKDRVAKARIDRRIKRAARGDYGDVKPVGENVSELRLHFGPGYRIYFTERNGVLFVVLAGGVKNTQREDIALAKEIAKAI